MNIRNQCISKIKTQRQSLCFYTKHNKQKIVRKQIMESFNLYLQGEQKKVVNFTGIEVTNLKTVENFPSSAVQTSLQFWPTKPVEWRAETCTELSCCNLVCKQTLSICFWVRIISVKLTI